VTGPRSDAFRFLVQATFGPRDGEVNALLARAGDPLTAYEHWIDEQMALEPSLQLPALREDYVVNRQLARLNRVRQETWFLHAMTAPDQLRQRVAFALSEIMVVSQRSGVTRLPYGLADYYDVLTRNAFGDFRALIEEVTLHPAMGAYLNMLGNRKPDEINNIRPDENYARELKQLFTIGLVQLNPDGTVKVGEDGVPLPTYEQAVVEGFAHVFTGWHYAGFNRFADAKRTNDNQTVPMKAYAAEHATGAKQLLSYPGAVQSTLPAGQTPEQDLKAALDNVFHHPNVGPFVGKQLIQRLVTSNPSPAYVARIAAVFADDGTGRRGNLGAVVKAILLDPEARAAPTSDVSGKAKEPLLRLLQLWRAYDAKSGVGRYSVLNADRDFGQGPLLSPSVFNFFSPSFAPGGEIADGGLVAPELQIATEYLNTRVTNFLYNEIFLRNSIIDTDPRTVSIEISEVVSLAGDPEAMVDGIVERLLGGSISPVVRDRAVAAARGISSTTPTARATEALYLIATSPEFAVQR
jgi:uncharacterized protein (DUF1800 family)